MTAPGLLEPLATTVPALSPRGKCDQQVGQMEYAREPKMARWRDLEAFCAPYSSNVDRTPQRTDVNADDILDETIFFARTTLGAFFASAMTNPSRIWSQWNVTDPALVESQAAKDWLHVTNDRRMQMLARSNFYDVMAWVYEEWPVFGTAVVLIEEDAVDLVRYVPLGIGSYALADDAKGNATALSRRFWMTARQLVERFCTDENGNVNLAALSVTARTAIQNGMLGQQFEVCHLICPNDDYSPTKQSPEHFAFASYYWEWGSGIDAGYGGFLAKEGYREWPAMVFRWKRQQGDPWGTDSPGLLTLGGNKSLQQMESDLLMAVEKQVKPPLVVPTTLTNASLLPAAKNLVDMRTGMQAGPLHTTDPNGIQIVAEVQQMLRERILSLWWTRLVLALTGQEGRGQKTAREVEEISQEKFLVLGRVVESAAGAFKVGSEREFAIMERAGVLPGVPEEMAGQPLTIEYTSLLAIAQKSVGLNNILQFLGNIAEIAKLTGDTRMWRKIDSAQAVDEIGARSGIPPRMIRPDAELEAMERAEAEAAAEERQVAMAREEAAAAKDLAQAPLGGDTALSALAGQGAQ